MRARRKSAWRRPARLLGVLGAAWVLSAVAPASAQTLPLQADYTREVTAFAADCDDGSPGGASSSCPGLVFDVGSGILNARTVIKVDDPSGGGTISPGDCIDAVRLYVQVTNAAPNHMTDVWSLEQDPQTILPAAVHLDAGDGTALGTHPVFDSTSNPPTSYVYVINLPVAVNQLVEDAISMGTFFGVGLTSTDILTGMLNGDPLSGNPPRFEIDYSSGPRTVADLVVNQGPPEMRDLQRGANCEPILRADVEVTNGTGMLRLTHFGVELEGTFLAGDLSRAYLLHAPNGQFADARPIGEPKAIRGRAPGENVVWDIGDANRSLNFDLPSGNSTVWVAVSSSYGATLGETVDARVAMDQITIESNTYPGADPDGDPGGERLLVADLWVPMSNGGVGARSQHTAVWTGSEMLVWGGSGAGGGLLNDGARYDPVLDSWRGLSQASAPQPRRGHTAVWTGREMIVWGGRGAGGVIQDGGYYDPAMGMAGTWTSGTGLGANVPGARESHTAVWTGCEMIVWGGFNGAGTAQSDGSRLDPITNGWTAVGGGGSPPGARGDHAAAWGECGMFVWGGHDGMNPIQGGSIYSVAANSWTAVNGGLDQPGARQGHSVVWTGKWFIVYGGVDGGGDLGDGNLYDPVGAAWEPSFNALASEAAAPDGRRDHTAVWTGREMVVWGGDDGGGMLRSGGGRYDPISDCWHQLPGNALSARSLHTAVWTGSEMLVWGGDDGADAVDDGARYSPPLGPVDTWRATTQSNAPPALTRHTAVWTGSEMIVYGGEDATGNHRSDGYRYDPFLDSWTTIPPNLESRRDHTAVWTGCEMIVWGGFGGASDIALNSGGRYDPVMNSWAAVSTTNRPSTREGHTAVWTGRAMIVWGGNDAMTVRGDGSMYDPVGNGWTATAMGGAPGARTLHTAVWTGRQMIVWGGINGGMDFNSGAHFDPEMGPSGSWSPTPMPPMGVAPRREHTAVWTGREMIVWGGLSGMGAPMPVNSGGRYRPNAMGMQWRAMSLDDAPTPRVGHTAVWTGREMIVWGGIDPDGAYDARGGRYEPATDCWRFTALTDAPAPRDQHVAVWTGREMVLWGGQDGSGVRGDGAVMSGGPPLSGLSTPRPEGPADNARFVTGTPTFRFVGFSDVGHDLDYVIHIDDDPAFGSPMIFDSEASPTLFVDSVTGLDRQTVNGPFPMGHEIEFTVPALTDGFWYWRVSTFTQCLNSTSIIFSPPRSFTVDGTLGAPYSTNSWYASWFQSSQAQFFTSRLDNIAPVGVIGDGAFVIANDTMNGTYETEPIVLQELTLDPTQVMTAWDRLLVTGFHEDNVVTLTADVIDVGDGSVVATGMSSTTMSGGEAYSLEVDLSGLNPVPPILQVRLLLTFGSSPQVFDVLLEGDPTSVTTAVSLTGLTARAGDGEVLVEWETGAELQNLGFNVYRSELPDRDFALLTDALVLALGDSVSGGRYYFHDTSVHNGRPYWYLVEDVETGRSTLHGPIQAQPQAGLPALTLDPTLYVSGQVHGGPAGPAVALDGSLGSGAVALASGSGMLGPGVRIISSDPGGFDIEIDVPRFTRGSVDAGGRSYDLLSIPDYGPSTALERPVVPTRNLLVEIAPGQAARLGTVVLESEQHGGYALPANRVPAEPPPVSELGPVPATHDGSQAWPAEALVSLGSVQMGARAFVGLRVNPIAWRADDGELTYHRRIRARLELEPLPLLGPVEPTPEETTQVALAGDPGALRIALSADGVYRITGAELAAAGFDLSRDPAFLWLHGRGRAIPLRVLAGGDGVLDPGDAVEFFGQRNQTTYVDSPETRYSDRALYWLSWGDAPGPRLDQVDGSPGAGPPVSAVPRSLRVEEQALVRRNPHGVEGSDHWFMDSLVGSSIRDTVTHTLALPDLVLPGAGLLRYRLRGASSDLLVPLDHHVELLVNGQQVAELRFDGYELVAGEAAVSGLLVGDNQVTVRVLGSRADRVLLDAVELEAPRRLVAYGRESLGFPAPQAGLYRVENLSDPQVEVWDVGEPLRPQLLDGAQVVDTGVVVAGDGTLAAGPSYQVTVDCSRAPARGVQERELWVVTPAGKRSPEELALQTPTQALRLGDHGADYLIITARSLAPAAARLAAHRQGRGLRAQVVFLDEILDEFAYGELDPEAITRFLRHAHDAWRQPRLKYVCLLGDGHYDYHQRLPASPPNLVPPRMLETEFSWAACDNRYATVSGQDVLPDLLIGRLPARDLADAQAMLDKLEAYEAAPFDPSWARRALFLADDPDIADFAQACDELVARLDPGIAPVRAYYPQHGAPGVIRQTILDELNGPGALLTVYAGHGSLSLWGSEDFFSSYRVLSFTPLVVENDVDALTNLGRPTIGLVLNCLSGDFAHTNPDLHTMGESWVRHAGGGAVAFWASSGLTRPQPQELLGRHLFDVIFEDGVGVLGDAIAAAKLRLAGDGDHAGVIDTWGLLGDPALSIPAPVPQLAQPNPVDPPPPPDPVVIDPPAPPPPEPTASPTPAPEAGPGPRRSRSDCALAAAPADPARAWPLGLLLLGLLALRRRQA